jgi:hypothetical protein
MNWLSAHELPRCPVQGHIPYGKAVQEQGHPWWGSVSIPWGSESACRFEGRSTQRSGTGDSVTRPSIPARFSSASSPEAPARAERYAMLLEEGYEAAERLKQAHDAGVQIEAPGDELADTAETARRDLDRIFNTGGVAALVGNTYGAAKDVGVYVTGEAIRGLADLEAKERERCANFASKAEAAGLAERTVWVAEHQGQLMVERVQAALREVDLSPEQASAFNAALARQARELTALP